MIIFSGSEDVLQARRKDIMDLYFHSLYCSSLPSVDNSAIHRDLLDLLHKKFSPNEKTPAESYLFSVINVSINLYMNNFIDVLNIKY